MLCIKCRQPVAESARECVCGYRFEITDDALPTWYDEYRHIIETAYLAAETSWQQSGKSGTFEEWTRLRIPISECVDASGTFLDIGCANGFLLECLLDWTKKKGINIIPYGLDMSAPLVELARKRLPQFKTRMFHGNALDWHPPLRFDYVRTGIEYVPLNYRKAYLSRLLNEFIADGGALLVVHYRGSQEDLTTDWIDGTLKELGFIVDRCVSGFSGKGEEKCRVAIVRA